MGKLFAMILALTAPLAFGQSDKPTGPIIEELSWLDTGYLERQRQQIDEVTRGEFGARLQGNKNDLRLLARIIEEGLVGRTEQQKLQAMGVVLGDIFVNELNLQWQVYQDSDGKSRAVCIPKKEHCLFPVTMISKRMEVGATPDPHALYERGEQLLKPYLPKLPYSAR